MTDGSVSGVPSLGQAGRGNFPLLYRLARLYCRHTPFPRGKWRLTGLIRTVNRFDLGPTVVDSKHGKFIVPLDERLYWAFWFSGEYEPHVSAVVRAVVKRGDVVIDAGANFGWFTVLMAQATGTSGRVHSFEPVPEIHGRAVAALDLNGLAGRVSLHRQALGDREGVVNLHVFEGLPDAHSSVSDLGRDDFIVVPAQMTTLDLFLETAGEPRVDVIKVDVEGAELPLLEGGRAALGSDTPPLLLIEVNSETSRAMGYRPGDLTDLLSPLGYEFFHIERSGALTPVPGADDAPDASMLVCAHSDHHRARLSALRIRGGNMNAG